MENPTAAEQQPQPEEGMRPSYSTESLVYSKSVIKKQRSSRDVARRKQLESEEKFRRLLGTLKGAKSPSIRSCGETVSTVSVSTTMTPSTEASSVRQPKRFPPVTKGASSTPNNAKEDNEEPEEKEKKRKEKKRRRRLPSKESDFVPRDPMTPDEQSSMVSSMMTDDDTTISTLKSSAWSIHGSLGSVISDDTRKGLVSPTLIPSISAPNLQSERRGSVESAPDLPSERRGSVESMTTVYARKGRKSERSRSGGLAIPAGSGSSRPKKKPRKRTKASSLPTDLAKAVATASIAAEERDTKRNNKRRKKKTKKKRPSHKETEEDTAKPSEPEEKSKGDSNEGDEEKNGEKEEQTPTPQQDHEWQTSDSSDLKWSPIDFTIDPFDIAISDSSTTTFEEFDAMPSFEDPPSLLGEYDTSIPLNDAESAPVQSKLTTAQQRDLQTPSPYAAHLLDPPSLDFSDKVQQEALDSQTPNGGPVNFLMKTPSPDKVTSVEMGRATPSIDKMMEEMGMATPSHGLERGRATPSMDKMLESGRATPSMDKMVPDNGWLTPSIDKTTPDKGKATPSIDETTEDTGRATPSIEKIIPNGGRETPSMDKMMREMGRATPSPDKMMQQGRAAPSLDKVKEKGSKKESTPDKVKQKGSKKTRSSDKAPRKSKSSRSVRDAPTPQKHEDKTTEEPKPQENEEEDEESVVAPQPPALMEASRERKESSVEESKRPSPSSVASSKSSLSSARTRQTDDEDSVHTSKSVTFDEDSLVIKPSFSFDTTATPTNSPGVASIGRQPSSGMSPIRETPMSDDNKSLSLEQLTKTPENAEEIRFFGNISVSEDDGDMSSVQEPDIATTAQQVATLKKSLKDEKGKWQNKKELLSFTELSTDSGDGDHSADQSGVTETSWASKSTQRHRNTGNVSVSESEVSGFDLSSHFNREEDEMVDGPQDYRYYPDPKFNHVGYHRELLQNKSGSTRTIAQFTPSRRASAAEPSGWYDPSRPPEVPYDDMPVEGSLEQQDEVDKLEELALSVTVLSAPTSERSLNTATPPPSDSPPNLSLFNESPATPLDDLQPPTLPTMGPVTSFGVLDCREAEVLHVQTSAASTTSQNTIADESMFADEEWCLKTVEEEAVTPAIHVTSSGSSHEHHRSMSRRPEPERFILEDDLHFTDSGSDIKMVPEDEEVLCGKRFWFLLVALGVVVCSTVIPIVLLRRPDDTTAVQDPVSREELVDLLATASFDRGVTLAIPGTPQNQALEWMVNLDRFRWPATSVDRFIQRYALATLFISTRGNETWFDSEGWMTGDDECTWFSSVSSACDDDGSYETLELRYNRLDGPLPPEIAMLSKLGKNVIRPKCALARCSPSIPSIPSLTVAPPRIDRL